MPEPRIAPARVCRFIHAALERLGLPAEDALTVARLMTQAEVQGSDGHGVIRLVPYARRIRAGGVNVRPHIRIAKEKPAMALLDGDNGMGHLVMQKATQIAIAKARQCGVAWVGARASNHAGPASLYARMALEHDMVGVYYAVGNANHLPPWGGLDMLLSTNPVAVAVPAGEEPPVVLDMATTVAAYGKVKARAQRGEPMPEGWMIDRQGQPLTDPKRAEEGFLLPIGGYKGYGLALVIGLLAGTLNGAAMGSEVIDFNHDDTTPTNTGQAILVIDPDAFGEVAEFKARVDKLVREMRASERLPGVERIWLPGEQSHEKRIANERDGLALSAPLRTQLDSLARELAIPPLADT
ncbi:Ldh family oxidoreductase [Ramlibacter alkalitolerans]|jgi:LDH2 family malate/lactate/ureidoglycolate dehydrogenase|uniref:Ldh family oxidoreductase n=1 Tax=Ramlibacter alkalitolerans TaxID=2039631 RepID=A0ABS1JIZ0_9BURK|nr:Ldh family oxidoreductase [Ramlibacter alkalitolerans]MBL0424193.1 Ldh family oxidoreductase [Ramlibacter alkalitolerans]